MEDKEIAEMREKLCMLKTGAYEYDEQYDSVFVRYVTPLFVEIDRLRDELKVARRQVEALKDILEAEGCPWEVAEKALFGEGGKG